jgi:peptidyl-prolyl cis-trans isomerase A (cyclophilin A)
MKAGYVLCLALAPAAAFVPHLSPAPRAAGLHRRALSSTRLSAVDRRAVGAALGSALLGGAAVQAAAAAEAGRTITFTVDKLTDGTSGEVSIELMPEWAPLGVARFEQLADTGFFNDCRFFRVLPNFIAQWGIPGTADEVNRAKFSKSLKDDPVTVTNSKGTV